jgi:hypothetical protein
MSSRSCVAHLNEFKDQGFTIFPALHTPEFSAGWRALVEHLAPACDEKQVIGNLIEIAPELSFRSIANPILLDFAERTMGPFVQLDGLTLVVWPPLRDNDPAASLLHWHRDPWAQVPRSTAYERPLAINALTYLQDLDERVGPLRIIPASHRTPLTIPTHLRSAPHPAERLINLKCGDVIVMHNNLVHSRTPNRSEASRCYVSVYYNLSWLRISATYDGPQAQEILKIAEEHNDRRVMRLLGVDTELQSRTNSGFLSTDEECWEDWIREDQTALRHEDK